MFEMSLCYFLELCLNFNVCFDVARICVGTWNVGGRVPPKDLDIDGWVDTIEPADIYVLGYVPFFLLVNVILLGTQAL